MPNQASAAEQNQTTSTQSTMGWQGPEDSIVFDQQAMQDKLADLGKPVYAVVVEEKLGLTNEGRLIEKEVSGQKAWMTPALPVEQLGSPSFRSTYGTKLAYYGGAMASAISSEEMVIALGQGGAMGSFGAAGNVPDRIESAIHKVQEALPQGPYAFNLIHSPYEEALERRAVELYLAHGVHVVEASAFLDLTPHIVRYRAAGLTRSGNGEIEIKNRVIAKLSRTEVATHFMQPAPEKILSALVADGRITQEQADLARIVPMADDVTVEGDSGGHTDNRPLVGLIPTMIALRDQLQEKHDYAQTIRIGAAGGISTPHAALGAYMMGADYVVTGSVNQACIESGASDHTKKLLADAGMADITMAPSSDMFEMGVKVQVLKKGTLFAMRAQKLYNLYNQYESLEAIPAEERAKLEKQIFQKPIDSIWQETVDFFTQRDPKQIERANQNPKRKMALVFRWYLGLSSRWSAAGVAGREMDYQIWCGPSMGTFNDWVRGTYLEKTENRKVFDVANQIMNGAAYQYRARSLEMQGVILPGRTAQYYPSSPLT
jgi:trans-AT polyketide synthase, acyltransferase and oxidoreductase domains